MWAPLKVQLVAGFSLRVAMFRFGDPKIKKSVICHYWEGLSQVKVKIPLLQRYVESEFKIFMAGQSTSP